MARLTNEQKKALLDRIKEETIKDIDRLGPGGDDALTSIYAIEGRDPFSIKHWLMQDGIPEDIADAVILRFARKILGRTKYGFDKNGISLLSRAIRDQAIKMKLSRDRKRLQLELKKELCKESWYKRFWRKFVHK